MSPNGQTINGPLLIFYKILQLSFHLMVCKNDPQLWKETKSKNNFEFNLRKMSLFERLFIMLNNLFHVFKTLLFWANTHLPRVFQYKMFNVNV